MLFLHEPLLYLLILPILFFLLSFKRDRGDISHFFNAHTLKKVQVGKDKISGGLSYRLFTLVVTLFILALARPVIKESHTVEKEHRGAVIVAMDLSASMRQKDIYPSRIDLAKQKLNYLVTQGKAMHIGVILFTQEAFCLYPISDDREALASIIKDTDFNAPLGKGSNLFAAIQASEAMLKQSKDKNILLLSDGGNSLDMSEELAYLKSKNLHLFALNIAKNSHQGLKVLSQKSGGVYKDFSWGESDIQSLMQAIENVSDTVMMKREEIDSFVELFIYPLTMAVILLLLLFGMRLPLPVLVFLLGFQLILPRAEAGLLDFYYLNKAKTLYEQEQYQEAIAVYKELDGRREVLYSLANALYQSSRYHEAIQEYKKFLLKPSKLEFKVHHNLGNCYVKLDKLLEAKKHYQNSLRLNSKSLSQKNLDRVIAILAKRARLVKQMRLRLPPKMCKKISVEHNFLEGKNESDYEVKMGHLVLSEEQQWLKRLEKIHTASFLQKIKTDKRSHNVEMDW